MKRLLVASLFGVLLILGTPATESSAGYGGDYGGGGSNTGAAPPGTVLIRDKAFNPPRIDARVGEAVAWKWEDGNVSHTVTADDGSFTSGEKMTGEFRQTFNQPGNYPYHCEIHPEMTGTVTVGG